jgi:hypothetical protein
MTSKFKFYNEISTYLNPEKLQDYIIDVNDTSVFINDYASYQDNFNIFKTKKNKVVKINLPLLDTKITKPQKLSVVQSKQKATAEAYTAEERNIIDLKGLDDIDISKIREGRVRKDSEVYSVNELKQIARRLKINVPTNKKELVDAILLQLKIIGKLK